MMQGADLAQAVVGCGHGVLREGLRMSVILVPFHGCERAMRARGCGAFMSGGG